MAPILGFLIAIAIGVTGVGGGVLTTPILIIFLGVPPVEAGSDFDHELALQEMNVMTTSGKLPSRIHRNAYVTRDLEATRKFYEELIGLPLVATWCEKDELFEAERVYCHLFVEYDVEPPQE